jgi:hypothetical protein
MGAARRQRQRGQNDCKKLQRFQIGLGAGMVLRKRPSCLIVPQSFLIQRP